MEALIEDASSNLSPSEALPMFKLLLRVFSNVLDNPSEAKYRSLPKSKMAGQLPAVGLRILENCGFVDQGESLALPGDSLPEALLQARELLDCLVLSAGEEPAAPAAPAPPAAPAAAAADAEEEDPELAEALRLSMAAENGAAAPPDPKRARAESAEEAADRDMAERMDKEDQERTEVAFERFRAEDVLVDADAVEKINQYCQQTGEKYVDPQFPPTDKSLYLSAEDATLWSCASCHKKNALPPNPPLPKSQEEAQQQENNFAEQVKCTACGAAAPYVVKVQYFTRPTQWLRPGDRCPGCELLYSHLPGGGKDLLPRMCPHFLRDSMSNTTVGSPWKLIRSEARAEDVCQGGIGNCWFAGALSVVASCPKLVEKLFETQDFNPSGAYQLQLHHAGGWRRMIIDDLLPTSQVFEGYMDGTHVYYSRGGGLCYLHCARRQLWVPFVEKAAAKLFGNYANLKGGTFGEALAMFTGFPTQRLQIYVPKEFKKRRAERRDARIERRTQMLLQGMEPPDDDESDEDDIENDDLKWSKILSASESGYLMGMGCTEEGCEKTKTHIVDEMGLQAPHAYGILDAREIQVGGKLQRLVKIRNPWGERAPRTWKGAWGKGSDKWTNELKLQLGVINSSNVEMEDPMSVFWMAFEDVKEYFGAVEVCRVHENWHESRTQVWLPCGIGPGEGIDVTVFRKTQVDIVIWQERHIAREAALGAKGTNIDVGFAVLRKRGPGTDGREAFDFVEYVRRSRADDVNEEMILEGGYVYRIVPVSYGLSEEYSARKGIVAIHSVQAIEATKVALDWRDTACAVFQSCKAKGKRRPVQGAGPGVTTWMIQDEAGLSFVVENSSDSFAAMQVDGSDSVGCVSSRGSFDAVLALPPQTHQVGIGISFALGATRAGCGVSAQGLPSDAAGFALAGEGLHEPLPLQPSSARLPPDQAILDRAPPEEPEPPTLSRGITRGSSVGNLDDEEMLAQAMKMSLEGERPAAEQTGASSMDEDELAEAIRLSMTASEVAAPAAPPPPAAPAPPVDPADKAKLTARVKVLFELYRNSGMPPNEAAAKALADAKAGL